MLITLNHLIDEKGNIVPLGWCINKEKNIQLDEIIKVLNEADFNNETIYIQHLQWYFHYIEPILIKNNWENRHVIPKLNHRGKPGKPGKTPPKSYEVYLIGKDRKCNRFKFATTNRGWYDILDADAWLHNGKFYGREIADEELRFFKQKNPYEHYRTPAKAVRELISNDRRMFENRIENDEYYDWLQTGMEVQPNAIVRCNTDYQNKLIPIAYHLDITSLYPYIVSTIRYFPDINKAVILNSEPKTDHSRYAYYPLYINKDTGEVFAARCNVTAESFDSPVLRAPLLEPNNFKYVLNSLFAKKNTVEKGTSEYQVTKLMLNGAIGSIVYNPNKVTTFFPFITKDDDFIKSDTIRRGNERFDIYMYIIEKAKAYTNLNIMEECFRGKSNEFLQVNTDGWFVLDKPKNYDEEKFLGSIRLEYEAHNLIIFAKNQYVCDEEICIAGLPSQYYKKGQTDYEYPIIRPKTGKSSQLVLINKHFTLGEVLYE